jgi:hypothetical protein
MNLSNHQFEFLKDLSSLIDFISNVKKIKITATWLHRPQEVQQQLYNEGLTKTLESNHLYSCAIDLNIFIGNRILTNLRKKDLTKEEVYLLNEIGAFWENLNKLNRWGGFWKSIYDPGHFERNVK